MEIRRIVEPNESNFLGKLFITKLKFDFNIRSYFYEFSTGHGQAAGVASLDFRQIATPILLELSMKLNYQVNVTLISLNLLPGAGESNAQGAHLRTQYLAQ